MEGKNNNLDAQKNFEESFDNILVFDYDKEYEDRDNITAESLVICDNRHRTSLNGEWHFEVDVFDSVIRSRWFEEMTQDRNGKPLPTDYSFDTWPTCQVPGVWNTVKKEYALYEGTGLYVKNFEYNNVKSSDKIFLRIGGANYESRIWLNKQYLGSHKGGFTPFMIDITKALKEENRLLIYVNNTRKSESVPSLHYDWFNYGGIHRDVELIRVPASFIKAFQINLVPDGNYNRLSYRLEMISGCKESEFKIKIPELGIEENIQISFQHTDNEIESIQHITGEIKLTNQILDLWSPVNPKLYDVSVYFEEDHLWDKIGFRQIETKETKILLNGEDIFLKGMCVHEESFKNLRCVTEEDMRQTLLDAKELNCNFLRLTHYPHNENMSKLADEIGILLWEEIPVYWALEFANKKTFSDAANQLEELIIRDINRASVIIWSVGNENPDSDDRYQFMSNLIDRVKTTDKSRLVAAACLTDMDLYRLKDRLTDKVDIIGLNEYCGWYYKDYSILEKILNNSEVNKPLIITETGAEAIPGKFGEGEIFSEDYQAEIYKNQFSILLKYEFIRGITPWILYDYASMRRMHTYQQGYNLKGIISKGRNYKKMAYYVVQNVYQKIK